MKALAGRLLLVERYFLYHVIRLFRIRDAGERVARGFSLGLIVNFYPTFGFGVVASGVVARLMGGNVAAGFAGGASLTFFWPLLFYLNMRVGRWVRGIRMPIEYSPEITEQMVSLAWGQSFMIGAAINSLVVGLVVYLSLWGAYRRLRPRALDYFRSHSREHQQRFALH